MPDRRRYTLAELLRVMERLRDPETGCPWDLQQDFRSIVPSTLEECYELAQAIEHRDYPHVAEELGDVLFQVVFYAQLGREQSLFSFEEIVDTLVSKLVRRHPHVFAGGEIEGVVTSEQRSTEADIKESWDSIKQQERAAKSQQGILDDVPVALPALVRAQKLQKRAARVGFDWHESLAVLDKLEEESVELRQALAAGDRVQAEEELGDLLFTCVNLARHLEVDPEGALRHANTKFERRFRAVERAFDHDLDGVSLDQMEAAWQRAKLGEK